MTSILTSAVLFLTLLSNISSCASSSAKAPKHDDVSSINSGSQLERFKDYEKLDAILYRVRDKKERLSLITADALASSYNSHCLAVFTKHLADCSTEAVLKGEEEEEEDQEKEDDDEEDQEDDEEEESPGVIALRDDQGSNVLISLVKNHNKISLESLMSFIKGQEPRNFDHLFMALTFSDSKSGSFFHLLQKYHSSDEIYIDSLRYLTWLVADAIMLGKDEKKGNSFLHLLTKKEEFEVVLPFLKEGGKEALLQENTKGLCAIEIVSKKNNHQLTEFLLDQLSQEERVFLLKKNLKSVDLLMVKSILERLTITIDILELILTHPLSLRKQKERITYCLKAGGKKWDYWKEDEVMPVVNGLDCSQEILNLFNEFFKEQKWQQEYGADSAVGSGDKKSKKKHTISSLHTASSSPSTANKPKVKGVCPIQCPISKEYRWGSVILIVLIGIFFGLWRRNGEKLKRFD